MGAERGERRDHRRRVKVAGIGLVVALAAGSAAAAGPGGGRGGYGYGYGYNVPTPAPSATATVTPTPTVTPPPPDTKPPRCETRPVRGQTSRSIRKRGLKLKVRCNEAARHVTRVFISKKLARKLGIKRRATRRVLVGKRTTLLKANVTKKVTVKLSKKARRGIGRMKRRHVRKLKLTIATSARDGANNVRRSSTTRSFKR